CNYKCSTNFHTENAWASCISNTRSCAITNWNWSQTWWWSSWGTCIVVSCDFWYVVNGNSCTFSWSQADGTACTLNNQCSSGNCFWWICWTTSCLINVNLNCDLWECGCNYGNKTTDNYGCGTSDWTCVWNNWVTVNCEASNDCW
ncbi:MAG: hypothetical protein ACD_4C00114G0005, partial [uncultured bacterium (gcode 4)]